MKRTAAIAELPETYATALRARDEDLSNEEISAQLGIEREAVAPLLRIAAAKLDAILAADDSPPEPSDTLGDLR
jgi:DNA-directed RNA polymerase specialized sigma24 family protein